MCVPRFVFLLVRSLRLPHTSLSSSHRVYLEPWLVGLTTTHRDCIDALRFLVVFLSEGFCPLLLEAFVSCEAGRWHGWHRITSWHESDGDPLMPAVLLSTSPYPCLHPNPGMGHVRQHGSSPNTPSSYLRMTRPFCLRRSRDRDRPRVKTDTHELRSLYALIRTVIMKADESPAVMWGLLLFEQTLVEKGWGEDADETAVRIPIRPTTRRARASGMNSVTPSDDPINGQANKTELL